MKIAVVGLGFMGATHIAAMRGVPGVELAAVVSSDERKLAGDLTAVSGNLRGPGERMDFRAIARYRELDECLEHPNVEAVDLCLPTDLHMDCAIAALRAGKHVLVEKPIALDGESADAMIAEAELAGRTLMCAQVVRFMPTYQAAADALKALGAVRSALFSRRCGMPSWSTWMTNRARSGGAIFDLLIHDIDYCLALFGRPESVVARGFVGQLPAMEWVSAELRFPGVGPVTIEGGWLAPPSYPFRAEFTVVAEGGTLEYSSAGHPLECLREGETIAIPTRAGDPFASQLTYFAQCAETGVAPMLCPPVDSAAAVRVAQCMLESRQREGKRVLCSI